MAHAQRGPGAPAGRVVLTKADLLPPEEHRGGGGARGTSRALG